MSEHAILSLALIGAATICYCVHQLFDYLARKDSDEYEDGPSGQA